MTRLEVSKAWLKAQKACLEAPEAWLEAPEAWLEASEAWLEAPWGDGQIYVRMYIRTYAQTPLFYRTLPPSGPLPKKYYL